MKLDGRPGREVPSFFREHFDIDVSEDTVERAVDAVRARNRRKKLRGPITDCGGRGDAPEDSTVAVWTDWLRIDERRLGIRPILIRVPNDGYELPGLVAALESMPGIRQVIETKERREIVAVGLVRTEDEEEALRARILEHVPDQPVTISAIRSESHTPTALTWLHLAKSEARAVREAES
jgi:hypothetical protein